MDRVSALMDGELDSRGAEATLDALKDRAEFREAWEVFHLIGDTMRKEHFAPVNPARIGGSVSARLAAEPAIHVSPNARGANRWWRAAGPALAMAAAVALVSWVVLSPIGPGADPSSHTPAPLAAAPTSTETAVSQEEVRIVSSPRIHPYLLAHQEVSPATAVQRFGPYVRSVSAGQTERAR